MSIGHTVLKVMSGSVGMQQQESVSMSVAHITLSKHEDVSGVGSHRERLGCQVAVHNRPYTSLDAELW